MTNKYHAIIADHVTGDNYWCGELAADTLVAAQREASELTTDLRNHDIVHVCMRDPERDKFITVASKMVCRDRWIDSYSIN
jgi:hypothetical protein